LAILEMDFGAPKPIAIAGSRIAMDLVDHEVEIGPGKPVAIVPGQTVFGKNLHGTGMAASGEVKDGCEKEHGQQAPKNRAEAEAVAQLPEIPERQRDENERENDERDEGGLVGPDDEASHERLRLSRANDE
jgi:hypothetical protein